MQQSRRAIRQHVATILVVATGKGIGGHGGGHGGGFFIQAKANAGLSTWQSNQQKEDRIGMDES